MSCNWNGYILNSFIIINWRASLVPAAAAIPAPIAYINVVAVKQLVVGSLPRTTGLLVEGVGRDPLAPTRGNLTWKPVRKTTGGRTVNGRGTDNCPENGRGTDGERKPVRGTAGERAGNGRDTETCSGNGRGTDGERKPVAGRYMLCFER